MAYRPFTGRFSKSRQLASFMKRAIEEESITSDGSVGGLDSAQVTAIASSVGGSGVTVYDSIGALPISHTVGDQAFVTGVSRLYFSNGTGWYSQNIINANPRWADSVGSGFGEPNGTLTIVDSATPLIVRAVGVDSDALPLTTSVTLSDSAQYVFDMSQDSSVFTFTPKTLAQAQASSVAGLIDSNSADINVTFKVTDGISILSKPSIITYQWLFTTLYDFTSFVFKPGTSTFNPGQHFREANSGSGATAMGPAGHTLAEYLANTTDYNQSTYTWLADTNYFNLYNNTRGFLMWTVPETATYTIKAMGGAGGGTTGTGPVGSLGGKGSFAQGNMSLTAGGKILLVIGHRGVDSTSSGTSGSGAGGSFVFYRAAGGTFTTSDIIMAGGGGGGATTFASGGSAAASRSYGGNGTTTTTGGNATWDERSGGANGQGGGYTGSTGGNWSGGDGAGLLSSGQTESRANSNPHSNGLGLAKGHHFGAAYPFYGGWHNQSSDPYYFAPGGFGGGSSGSYGPGGGGGYSGGAGDHNEGTGANMPHNPTSMPNGAGGGSIFFHASATSTSVGVNTNIESGSITITKN